MPTPDAEEFFVAHDLSELDPGNRIVDDLDYKSNCGGGVQFPTQASLEDLQTLVAACNDRSGAYIFWIDLEGEVHVTWAKAGEKFNEAHERIYRGGAAYMFETLRRNRGCVGPDAASNLSWMAELRSHLDWGWFQVRGGHWRDAISDSQGGGKA
jgi:hypothetical protein